MSSSRLNPAVTPSTAFAIRLRARPWNLPSSGSGRERDATSSLPFSSNVMPGGTSCFSVPLGPFTSTPSALTLTVTPLGTGIGFLPIRDISGSSAVLPNRAEHFAAHAGLHRILARHHATRGGEDAGAQAGHDLR